MHCTCLTSIDGLTLKQVTYLQRVGGLLLDHLPWQTYADRALCDAAPVAGVPWDAGSYSLLLTPSSQEYVQAMVRLVSEPQV